MIKKNKTPQISSFDIIDLLLDQLEELTDPQSIFFDQDILEEKEEIKRKIIKGEITIA